jgi:hypothetical protein
MSQSQRVKGQETTVIVVANGVVQSTLNDVSNFNAELDFEVISKGYLGQTTNLKDMIFNGAKFDLELNTYTQDWTTLVSVIKALAQRTAPNNVVNITGVMEYPNGDTPSMLFSNCQFGPIPVNFAARNEYVKHKFSGETSDVIIQTS